MLVTVSHLHPSLIFVAKAKSLPLKWSAIYLYPSLVCKYQTVTNALITTVKSIIVQAHVVWDNNNGRGNFFYFNKKFQRKSYETMSFKWVHIKKSNFKVEFAKTPHSVMGATTLSIMTLSIMGLFVTVSIIDTEHKWHSA